MTEQGKIALDAETSTQSGEMVGTGYDDQKPYIGDESSAGYDVPYN